MNEKVIVSASLFAVLLVGVASMVGISRANTGLAVQDSHYCDCYQTQVNYQGYHGGWQWLNSPRVNAGEQHTHQHCDMRCKAVNSHSRSSNTRTEVVGWARPEGAPRGSAHLFVGV